MRAGVTAATSTAGGGPGAAALVADLFGASAAGKGADGAREGASGGGSPADSASKVRGVLPPRAQGTSDRLGGQRLTRHLPSPPALQLRTALTPVFADCMVSSLTFDGRFWDLDFGAGRPSSAWCGILPLAPWGFALVQGPPGAAAAQEEEDEEAVAEGAEGGDHTEEEGGPSVPAAGAPGALPSDAERPTTAREEGPAAGGKAGDPQVMTGSPLVEEGGAELSANEAAAAALPKLSPLRVLPRGVGGGGGGGSSAHDFYIFSAVPAKQADRMRELARSVMAEFLAAAAREDLSSSSGGSSHSPVVLPA